MVKEVLVVCTHNAVRSQMAEAVINRDVEGWSASSAGTAPVGVNPLVRRILEQEGYDVRNLRSKGIQEFQGRDFDLVLFVCGGAAEGCVNYQTSSPRLRLPLQDPVATNEGESRQAEAIRGLLAWMRSELPQQLRDAL
ncbi:MAG: arsenate reductase ArsC [Candidatus Methanomethylophilaceae archaeon]